MEVLNGECCGPAVAEIDVDGILLNMDMTGPGSAGENPVSLFRERLDAAAADPCTRAVVVRINTYGGGVTACDMMRHDLEMFKNRTGVPVVACLLDTGAGGGYYIATAADQIVATPTTITGGIGVILNLYNIEDFLTKNDVHSGADQIRREHRHGFAAPSGQRRSTDAIGEHRQSISRAVS